LSRQGQSGKHILALSFSGFDPTQTLQLQPRRAVHKTTIDAIDELAEKIWDLEGDLLEALSLF
jgi:hypothetical protein